MIRNSIVAAGTAGVVAFSIWFQATQTVPHDVKSEEGGGAETSQVEPAGTAVPTPGATTPVGPDETDGTTDTETKDETSTETNEQSGKPGETKP
jgi:hypothetical protein